MRGLNRVILVGNLARDPDVRYAVNKKAYARFSLAIASRRKEPNGEWKDSVEYAPVVVFGQIAENCGKYLKKGSGVVLEGRIVTNVYDAKDGSGKRYSTEVIAESVQFIGGGSSGQSSGNSHSNNSSSRVQSRANNDYMPTDEDFGKSIGESGFNSEVFLGEPDRTNNNFPVDMSEADIPF